MLHCARLGLLPCGIKTLCMAVGRLPSPLPRIFLCASELAFVEKHAFVGMDMTPTKGNLHHGHYLSKASKARRAVNALFGLNVHVGTVPPWKALRIYQAAGHSSPYARV